MTLPFSRLTSVPVRLWFSALPQCAGAGLLVLMLSGCGSLPWTAQDPQRPVARRRAVPASQRQESRMARPAPESNRPAVDYGPYKRIHLGMAIADVQALLGEGGQRYEGGALDAQTQFIAEKDASSGSFWRWTHPSGVYDIHVRFEPGPKPIAAQVVKAKWLTYNPPE